MKKIAVLISNKSQGTNLQKIIDAIENKKILAMVAVVISDQPDAFGLQRAKKHNIKTHVLKKTENLTELLAKKFKVDYVILAGWIKIIKDDLLKEFKNRILNIHPGLIPDTMEGTVNNPDGTQGLWNRGKFTEKAVQNFLDNYATYAGSTVHFLTHEFDFGPVLARGFEKIERNDTVETLYERLKKKEHEIVVYALQKLCNTDKRNDLPIKYALLSVYDKTGIVEFAQKLTSYGFHIISTGGTAKTLTENGVTVIPINEITGNPESFDGRMKTISFQVESGILYDRTNPTHVKQAKELHIKPIDLVVCNLYPFEETVSKKSITIDDAVENIDVGGPTMIRSAAKNFKNVTVVVDPNDYKLVEDHVSHQTIDLSFNQQLAAKAFAHLSFYDSQIANYFSHDLLRTEMTLAGRKSSLALRYGENPHQQAAMYFQPNYNAPLKNLKKESGRDLSLTNITDINAGVESIRLFDEPCAVVIKHNTPCGIALGNSSKQALERAIEADPESAFGGVIVLNEKMDLKAAKIIGSFKDERKSNIDIVACPAIEKDALEFLQKTRKTMGIYTFGKLPKKPKSALNLKWIDGGYILQTSDENIEKSYKEWKVVTTHKITAKQKRLMEIGWKFISRIRSNAIIIIDKDLPITRGIGTGQTSRVRSTKIALAQAGKYAKNAILISDSFFPFDDSIKIAAKYKIGAVLQQGGSINDELSIKTANKLKIPMVFTGRRAFWH